MKKFILASFAVSALTIGSMSAMADGQDPAVMGDTSMGKVWVNAKGMTLYTYDKDTAGQSTCVDDCAKTWQPMMAEKGAKISGNWTLVARADGSNMWAYKGHPMYTYGKDGKAGDVAGNGINGFHMAQ